MKTIIFILYMIAISGLGLTQITPLGWAFAVVGLSGLILRFIHGIVIGEEPKSGK